MGLHAIHRPLFLGVIPPTPTFCSVFVRALLISERDVGDVLQSYARWFWRGRSGVGCAHVRGTDGYISLGVYVRSVGSEGDVADGPTVVGAITKPSALFQIALTSGGLTATFRSVFLCALVLQSAM